MIAADILSLSDEQTRNSKLLWRSGAASSWLAWFFAARAMYGDQSTRAGTTSV